MQQPSEQELVQRYLDRKHADIRNLECATAVGDFALVQRIGHNLAGSGAAYGFIRITHLGTQIEAAARQRAPGELAGLIEDLRRFLETVIIADTD